MTRTQSAASQPADAWSQAVELLARHLAKPGRAEEGLAHLPGGMPPVVRARIQALLLGSIRWLDRVQAALGPHLRRRPSRLVEAALLVALAECLDEDGEVDVGRAARCVDHAVGRLKAEGAGVASFANAVLRRGVADLQASAPSRLAADAPDEAFALAFAHPLWMVKRWRAAFGAEALRVLLAWNQRAPLVHGRWLGEGALPAVEGIRADATHPDRFTVGPGAWSSVEAWLDQGKAVVMDPASSRPVDLLAPAEGETVLDLCAAPGGKTRLLAAAVGAEGGVVAVDLPGPRLEKLSAGVTSLPAPVVALGGDLAALSPKDLEAGGLPAAFAAVLLDAPCSNTGVLRRRPDARHRLREEDIARCAALQAKLLRRAAAFVAPGGRLVYSTCSLEAEENERVVRAFLASPQGRGWRLAAVDAYTPWQHGHDGGSAHRLERPEA